MAGARTVRTRPWAFALAILSGVLYFVGFCGLEQWYLAWICLAPVLWALDDPRLTGWQALGIAWIFGLTTHLGGYTWIVGLLRKFAYLPLPAAFLGYFLLCLAQGSILAVWGWGVNRLTHKGVSVVWSAPVVMVALEWLYPLLFPSYLANSQYRQITFIQTLDLWGPLGITFILALASATLYAVVATWARPDRPNRRFPTAGVVATVALVGGSLIYGAGAVVQADDAVASADRRLRIGLVQANMGIYEKTRDPDEGLRRHRDGSVELERQGVDLIVWPESGYYYAISDAVKNVRSRVMGPVRTPILFGALRVELNHEDKGEHRYFNSSFLAGGDGTVLGTYDKNILLAFGETLPFSDWFPWMYDLLDNSTHFARGEHTNPVELDGVRFGILICFEDIMPSFARKVMQHERPPHVLVNLTNDAWFGDTREPLIHLALATFRAVETRRFLVRSTNTGISAFIDPAGRILSETPTFARANLVGEVAALEGRTLYVHLGNWVGTLCLLALAVWWREELRAATRWLAVRLAQKRAGS